MIRRLLSYALFPAFFLAGLALAQYPILDMVADKVIQKYQSSTCEQLWQNRGKHSQQEMEVVQKLRENPGMRREFLNRIAGPVMNRMFECGMVP
ncbi:MAG: hypothetical protein R3357_01320 [Burkholderiales bacterium]|nr:hypothetical protein [Burkholderiales bacterium]